MATKLLFDIGKKVLPNASRIFQKKFKQEYDELRVFMSPRSAEQQALRNFRKKYPKEPGISLTVPTKKSKGGLMDYYKDIL